MKKNLYLSDALKFLYPFIGFGAKFPKFVKQLFDAYLEEVKTNNDSLLNSFYDYTDDYISRVYKGTKRCNKKLLSNLISHSDSEHFQEYIKELSVDSLLKLGQELVKLETDFELDQDDLLASVSNGCVIFITNALKNEISLPIRNKKKALLNIIEVNENARRFIQIDGKKYELPKLIPEKDQISKEEFVYTNEMMLAIAEKCNLPKLEFKDLNKLEKKYSFMFNKQRQNFYCAESVRLLLRDILDKGEDEFDIVKNDTFNGVLATYFKDYANGWDKMLAVLEQSCRIVDSHSNLYTMKELYGPEEKSGICHMLVNDKKLVWRVRDE